MSPIIMPKTIYNNDIEKVTDPMVRSKLGYKQVFPSKINVFNEVYEKEICKKRDLQLTSI